MSGKTCLYRGFDADGTLLYVGISIAPTRRFADHKRGAPWFDAITTLTLVHFATKEEAITAEAEAIREERPAFNIAHAEPYENYLARTAVPAERLSRRKVLAKSAVDAMLRCRNSLI